MPKIFHFILIIFSILLLTLVVIPRVVYADELSEIEKKLGDLKHALELSVAATNPLEKSHDKLQAQLDDIKNRITGIEKDIVLKQEQVVEGEKLLGLAEDLLGTKVRQLYKASRQFAGGPLVLLLSQSLYDSLRQMGYQKAVINNDRDTIVKVVIYIKELEQRKKTLEDEKSRLAVIKQQTDEQAAFLAKEISGAKKYQAALSTQIASLSARQQQLIAEKLASLNLPTSLGAGPLFCTDDRKIDPGFRPAFAFYTFGIPHRIGMNQYGALGRAKAGQDYKAILTSYFNNVKLECKSTNNKKIRVQGFGEMDLEEYLKGIYEMPGDWPIEALKAQVVAARSYALSYTDKGNKEICTTQACQVYKGGNKGGNWEEAVKQTGTNVCSDNQGEVLMSNDTNDVVTAWYASTAGGYTFRSADVGWNDRPWTKRMRDTTGDVNSFQDLFDRAYDKESPCFYAAQGFRSEYGKSAWLKSEEVADMVNVLLLAKRDSGVQKHLYQPDKSNPEGAETWDRERVKSELKSRGGNPFSSISDVSVDWDKGVGRATTVRFNGDAGSVDFDASEFRNFFNLRAPANIQIVGPLYNIEKK